MIAFKFFVTAVMISMIMVTPTFRFVDASAAAAIGSAANTPTVRKFRDLAHRVIADMNNKNKKSPQLDQDRRALADEYQVSCSGTINGEQLDDGQCECNSDTFSMTCITDKDCNAIDILAEVCPTIDEEVCVVYTLIADY